MIGFWLQKLVLGVLLPPASLIVLALLGWFLVRCRLRVVGRIMLVVSAAGLVLLSLEPVASRLIAPLENEYPPLVAVPVVDAVVVLTAGTLDMAQRGLGGVPDGGSSLRLAEGIRICRRLDEVPLVVCGGRADPARPQLSAGRAMARMAIDLGVAPERLLLEEESHNTYEGARQVKKLLSRQDKVTPTIVLVTSAFHMGRSVNFFTRAGFKVVAAPTDFHAQAGGANLASFIPSAGALNTSATAIYEYLTRLRYLLAT